MEDQYHKTKESVEEYIKLAKDVDSGPLIAKLNLYLPSKLSLLELGSGPGTDFGILKKNYKVVGSDYSNEFLERLFKRYPNDEFLNLDAVTLKTTRKFDGIYSNKVLQHLTDEELEKSILRQAELLSHNGIICHSFWKGEGDEVFKGLRVNYQTINSLRILFANHFDVLLLETYEEFETSDSLLLIGKKK